MNWRTNEPFLNSNKEFLIKNLDDKYGKKESAYLLQCIDCNCNNCGYFVRDISLTNQRNKNEQIVACKIHYGQCSKFGKVVGEIANIALLHTQHCFVHRKDFLILGTGAGK